MRRLSAFLVLLFLVSSPATASREPSVAPAPEWVERIAIPSPNPALADRPVQALLMTVQNRYAAESSESYIETATLIQNSQGLAAGGNIVLPWKPEDSDLIVHRAQIVRGGTTIDLLAGGREFTVLRRENNLESATLDGVLTAVLQPEGLAVGDILNVAFTVRRRASAIPVRADTFYWSMYGASIRRSVFRDVWAQGTPMRWQTASALGRATDRNTRWGRELRLDVTDFHGQQPTEDAPPRFLFAEGHQVSGWRDWSEISVLMAPLFDRAQQLAPDSPLRREIERIAAASPEPSARALAALRLVQDDIRYLALSMGDGGYVPASADQTWTRRFGDCKGKTVLLLALLDALGIVGEPVLVSSMHGDGLGERLPSLALFDHVLVRARIGERSYFLDGTRTGDRSLENLASFPFGHGLALRPGGATLELLPWAPPASPTYEINIVHDASAGIAAMVPTRAEMTFRGDAATQWRLQAAQAGTAEIERAFSESFRNTPEGERPTEVHYRENPDGSVTISMSGRARLDWERAPSSSGYRMAFGALPEEYPESLLHAAADRQVPIVLAPANGLATSTLILPNGGTGYSVEGANSDREVAGVRVGRTSRIEGGRFIVSSWYRTTVREIAPAAIRAGRGAAQAAQDEKVWLRAPAGFRPAADATIAPASAAVTPERREAGAHVAQGFEHMRAGRHQSAITEMDAAIRLAPDWSRPYANRGISLIHRNQLDEAERSLRKALELDDGDFVVHQGLGFLALKRDRPEEAIQELGRSLELDPGNHFNFLVRAEAFAQLGRFEESLRDIDLSIAARPQETQGYILRARLLAQLGRPDEGLRALDQADAASSGNPIVALARADILMHLGRAAEASAARRMALQAYDTVPEAMRQNGTITHQRMLIMAADGRAAEAIAIADAGLRRQADNVRLLAARCHVRAIANVDLPAALRDCNLAVRYDSGDEPAMLARALTRLRMEQWPEAVADFDQLISWNSHNAPAFYGRGIAKLRRGDREGGERDLATARRYAFDVANLYEPLGIRP